MDANLRAAHTREKLLCPIGASVVYRIGVFVVGAGAGAVTIPVLTAARRPELKSN